MEFHPIAECLPLMQGEEFEGLVEDIRSHGLREPITVYEGKILDGRNRYRACEKLDMTPEYRDWDSRGSPIDFVVSMNVNRRHLSESQRAMVAARLANLKQGRPEKNSPIGDLKQSEAAKKVNVGKRSVERARKILNHGDEELIGAVDRGDVKVSAAVRQIEGGAKESSVTKKQQKEDEPRRRPRKVSLDSQRVRTIVKLSKNMMKVVGKNPSLVPYDLIRRTCTELHEAVISCLDV